MAVYATATPKNDAGSYYNQSRDAYSGSGFYKDIDRDRMEFIQGELSADNALQRQIEFYDSRQSPAALIRQLKEAGLSPSIYASGGLPGGSGTSGISGSGGGGNTGGSQALLGILSAIKDISLTGAEISKTKAERDLLKAQTKETLTRSDNNAASTELIKYQTETQKINNMILKGTSEWTIKSAAQAYENLGKQGQLIEEQITQVGLQNQYDSATMQERINQAKEQTKLIAQEVAIKVAEEELTKANKKLTDEQINKIKTETQEINDRILSRAAERDILNKSYEAQKTFWEAQADYYNDQIDAMYERMNLDIEIKNRDTQVETWKIMANMYTSSLSPTMRHPTLNQTEFSNNVYENGLNPNYIKPKQRKKR